MALWTRRVQDNGEYTMSVAQKLQRLRYHPLVSHVYPDCKEHMYLRNRHLKLTGSNAVALDMRHKLSQRVICGLYAVGGCNFGGIDDPLGPGFFVRVDLIADEQFVCEGLAQ